MSARVLILGGTGEARRLAGALAGRPGLAVVSSLAGRVRTPALPAGEVRIGGFGGVDGLAEYLRASQVRAVVDATHPFAAVITESAVTAARRVGVPLLLLRRPGWTPRAGDDWHWVRTLGEAASALPALGERVFLTTGRLGLAAFAGLDRHWFLVRSVDPPDPPTPKRMQLLLARGPFTLPGERALLTRHRIHVLVTKDSGGEMTAAKLHAARELGIPVVIQTRPPAPDAPTETTVEAAVRWLNLALRTS
jgi:precorrin-6A/cobalt-precorrin-6A reductase